MEICICSEMAYLRGCPVHDTDAHLFGASREGGEMQEEQQQGEYSYTVRVTCRTADEADQVMAERLGPDEDYGFEYAVEWVADRSVRADA